MLVIDMLKMKKSFIYKDAIEEIIINIFWGTYN